MARDGRRCRSLLIAAAIGMIARLAPQTYRYVLPLMPFLLPVLLVIGRARVSASARRIRDRVALACSCSHTDRSRPVHLREPGGRRRLDCRTPARSMRSLTGCTANIPGRAARVHQPRPIYLRTGRKAVGSVEPLQNWEQWRRPVFVTWLRCALLEPPRRL